MNVKHNFLESILEIVILKNERKKAEVKLKDCFFFLSDICLWPSSDYWKEQENNPSLNQFSGFQVRKCFLYSWIIINKLNITNI